MPRHSKRAIHCQSLNEIRYSTASFGSESESSTSGEEMEMEMEFNNTKDKEKIDFEDQVFVNDIADVFQLCKATCPLKYLSVLMYMTLRHVGLNWKQCDDILHRIGSLSSETAHKNTEVFIFGDFEEFTREHRGGKHSSEFWDYFPEIEKQAKAYTLDRCSEKAANFTVNELAKFIDEKYYETTETMKIKDSELIRSEASVRLDLRRWGAKFKENGARPYWEGHERSDVVESRQAFVKHFIDRKDHYYTVNDNEEIPGWITPKKNSPSILIFHDESTFRSGEIASKRWFFGDQAPFYSKGRGHSNMVSDFLVQHSSGPFFSLSSKEMERAVQKYPQLAAPSDLDYVERTATASLHVGYDSYMDNSAILGQCERIFQMVQFKEAYRGHTIEFVFDNARTHTAKSHSLNDFSKNIGTKCAVDRIEYKDSNGHQKVIECFFQSGPNQGLSKGLVEIARELNVKKPESFTLPQLRAHLSNHPAFKNVSRLELLANEYNVTIHFCPKFHCELNITEGLWCFQKQYVRKNSNQMYPTMLKNIAESRELFSQKDIHLRLVRRFWKALESYQNGKSYTEVMKSFFSTKCEGRVASHTRISNSNLVKK